MNSPVEYKLLKNLTEIKKRNEKQERLKILKEASKNSKMSMINFRLIYGNLIDEGRIADKSLELKIVI